MVGVNMVGVNMVVHDAICECVEGTMLEPCLLKPCFFVAGFLRVWAQLQSLHVLKENSRTSLYEGYRVLWRKPCYCKGSTPIRLAEAVVDIEHGELHVDAKTLARKE